MANDMPVICLSAPAYYLGEPVPIAELPLSAAARSVLLGADGGLEYCRVSALSVSEMAERCAVATLEQSELAREAIDTVMIASNSLRERSHWAALMDLPRRLGLPRALPVLVNSGDCCNFHTALRHAWSLSHAGGAQTLLVVADRVADVCPGDYMALRDAGVNSDAAASCLIGTSGRGGIELLAPPTRILDPRPLADPQRASPDEFMRIARFARELFDALYRATGRSAGEVERLIANTYRRSVVEVFALAARLPAAKAYLGNVARTGHCFAADNLINLADALAEGAVNRGDLILAMSSGVNQWSGFLARSR